MRNVTITALAAYAIKLRLDRDSFDEIHMNVFDAHRALARLQINCSKKNALEQVKNLVASIDVLDGFDINVWQCNDSILVDVRVKKVKRYGLKK